VKPVTATIDLNADLGEGAATDAELLAIVSSCNVACGGHAGDAASMAATVAAAAANGVAVGAHPSYPDREGFGRQSAFIGPGELAPALEAQVSELLRVAGRASVRVGHVKPHGALYNDAAKDRALADAICHSVMALDPTLVIVGPPDSALGEAAERAGLAFVAEGFVDRAYQADGALVPRSEPGSVYADAVQASRQAVDIAVAGRVTARDGSTVSLPVQTLCIHGDTPGAVELAKAVRNALVEAGVSVAARGLSASN
jgi:UPF0271 protein